MSCEQKLCINMAWLKSLNEAYGRFLNVLEYMYLQYLLMTAIYMLEPWEQKLINSILIGLLAMIFYTGFIFLPRYMNNIMDYSGYMAGSWYFVVDAPFQTVRSNTLLLSVFQNITCHHSRNSSSEIHAFCHFRKPTRWSRNMSASSFNKLYSRRHGHFTTKKVSPLFVSRAIRWSSSCSLFFVNHQPVFKFANCPVNLYFVMHSCSDLWPVTFLYHDLKVVASRRVFFRHALIFVEIFIPFSIGEFSKRGLFRWRISSSRLFYVGFKHRLLQWWEGSYWVWHQQGNPPSSLFLLPLLVATFRALPEYY